MVSKNPGKQRRTSNKAALHVQRKRLRARLLTDDPELQAIRTVTVRVGDEVEVVRGDFGNPNSVKSSCYGTIPRLHLVKRLHRAHLLHTVM